MGTGTGIVMYPNTDDTQAMRGAPMFRHWDDVVRGGDGSSERRKWSLRLAERSKQNQGKGIDTKRASSFTSSWIDLEQCD